MKASHHASLKYQDSTWGSSSTIRSTLPLYSSELDFDLENQVDPGLRKNSLSDSLGDFYSHSSSSTQSVRSVSALLPLHLRPSHGALPPQSSSYCSRSVNSSPATSTPAFSGYSSQAYKSPIRTSRRGSRQSHKIHVLTTPQLQTTPRFQTDQLMFPHDPKLRNKSALREDEDDNISSTITDPGPSNPYSTRRVQKHHRNREFGVYARSEWLTARLNLIGLDMESGETATSICGRRSSN